MADYIYPNNQLEDGSQLFEQVGDFWNSIYNGSDFIFAYCKALGRLSMQNQNDLDEFVASSSRLQIPVHHNINWKQLTLLNSTKVQGSDIKWGDSGLVFGYQPSTGIEYVYGHETDSSVQFPIDSSIKDVSIITNRITDPSVVLIKDVDFTIDTTLSTITFRDDPFKNSLIPVTAILDNANNQVDSEVDLWLFKSKTDTSLIYNNLGYVAQINYPSSQRYLDFLNALFDAITGGSSVQTFLNALVAVTDIPLVLSDNETVQDIENDHVGQLIITDKNVYRFSTTATPIVSVGSVVNKGDPLVDALQIFADGKIPSSSLVSQLTVPANYFQIALTGGLTFSNSLQNTTVGTDGNGKTTIQFPLTGASADITAFWNAVQSRATTFNTSTLAELLDTRTTKTGEPTASNLPTQINPLQFLIQNVFRCNFILVSMKTAQFGPNALGTGALTYLRKIVPSHMALFVLQQ